MKMYCIDTSGFSNPLEKMPEDIYESLWIQVVRVIEEDSVAVTREIYDEMTHIRGRISVCINANPSLLVLEFGEDNWDWESYAEHLASMRESQKDFISEYNGQIDGTIGLTDLSIIALAKTLSLPVVSMESRTTLAAKKRRRIPDVCGVEQVEHLEFNDFLRRENIKLR